MDRVEVLLHHIFKVPNMNLLVRMTGHEYWILAAHLMDWFADIRLANLRDIVSIDSPEFDHAVPTSRNEETSSLDVE